MKVLDYTVLRIWSGETRIIKRPVPSQYPTYKVRTFEYGKD
jgi:hypothetical protein